MKHQTNRIRKNDTTKTAPVQPAKGHADTKSGHALSPGSTRTQLEREIGNLVSYLREENQSISQDKIKEAIRKQFQNIAFTDGDLNKLLGVENNGSELPDYLQLEIAVRQSNALAQLLFETLCGDNAAVFHDNGSLAARHPRLNVELPANADSCLQKCLQL